MKIVIDLENGSAHELTKYELRVLQMAVANLSEILPHLTPADRKRPPMMALENLKMLFLNYP